MDINEIKSELKMENFHFVECYIKREATINSGPMSIDLNKKIDKMEDGAYSVMLTLTIGKEHGDMDVKVVAAATFTIDNDDTEFVRSIIETNTVAIMFPFIRSQVSLLTTQPGMTPIVLPTINTAKFESK